MTPEQLLFPRYEISAEGYPEMPFAKGQIVTLDFYVNRWTEKYPRGQYSTIVTYNSRARVRWLQEDFERFPSAFKKLRWWEQRLSVDLPLYVKTTEAVYRVRAYVSTVGGLTLTFCTVGENAGDVTRLMNHCRPATEEQYRCYTERTSGYKAEKKRA